MLLDIGLAEAWIPQSVLPVIPIQNWNPVAVRIDGVDSALDVASLAPHRMFAVNADYANDASVIPAAAEVASIPPVSGG